MKPHLQALEKSLETRIIIVRKQQRKSYFACEGPSYVYFTALTPRPPFPTFALIYSFSIGFFIVPWRTTIPLLLSAPKDCEI